MTIPREMYNSYNISLNKYLQDKMISYKLGPGFRGSCLQMSFKIDVLKNFAIFTEKHMCWRLHHRCFPVNVTRIFLYKFL